MAALQAARMVLQDSVAVDGVLGMKLLADRAMEHQDVGCGCAGGCRLL
jgi:hypothetical protein